jgi:hypothetical protein
MKKEHSYCYPWSRYSVRIFICPSQNLSSNIFLLADVINRTQKSFVAGCDVMWPSSISCNPPSPTAVKPMTTQTYQQNMAWEHSPLWFTDRVIPAYVQVILLTTIV